MIYSALNGHVIYQGMVTPFNKGCLAEATHTASDSCSDCTAGHVYDDNMLPPRYPRRASKTYMRPRTKSALIDATQEIKQEEPAA